MSFSPAQWLLNIAKSAPVTSKPWRQSIRMALVTCVPLIFGFLSGQMSVAIVICLGGFLTTLSLLGTDPYHARFHRLLILTPFGMLGYLLGGTLAGHGLFTLVGVTFVAFASGLISGYGAVFSLSAMQLLIMTVISSHAPSSASIWLMPFCFMLGALFSALLLEIEALFYPNRPERELLSHLFGILSKLTNLTADESVDKTTLENARRAVVSAQSAAYQALIHDQSHQDGRTRNSDQVAQILAITDRIMSLLASNRHKADDLKLAAAWLDKMSAAILFKAPMDTAMPAEQNSDIMIYNIQSLSQIVFQYGTTKFSTHTTIPLSAIIHNITNIAFLKQQLIIGPKVIRNTIRLTLCMFLALLAEKVVPGQRSYWLPLTVAVIMKTDAGSVYVRALHRSFGTAAGVIVAALMFTVMPKDMWLVAVVAFFAVLIPWASLKSYAWQCAAMTPLVLILMDLLVPGPTVDYGMQRVADTIMGAAVVLIFGYLIWPKTTVPSIREAYQDIIAVLASYLDNIASAPSKTAGNSSPAIDNSVDFRRDAYKKLSDLRVHLQQALAEPPPVSTDARAWLPAIAAAERICDDITSLAAAADQEGVVPCKDSILQTATLLKNLPNMHTTSQKPADYDGSMLTKGGAMKALFETHEDVLNLYSLTAERIAKKSIKKSHIF